MEYVRYGSSGMVVSKFCWGAMNFWEREGDEGGIRMVHEALDAGINFFDTADTYGDGKSETLLGKALKSKRDHVVIATKLWVQMYEDDRNGRGCGRYHMMRAVEDSLRRLGTDRIDLYQLHHPDNDAPVEETLATLDMLVKQGKVRYFGVCNHYAWQMAHMLGVSALRNFEPIVSVQCHYNIFNRAVETEISHFCRRFNLAAIVYGPLGGGVLSGKLQRGQSAPEGSRVQRRGLHKMIQSVPGTPKEKVEEDVFVILNELQTISRKYELGVNQLAMKWVLSKDWITCPILGGSRAEHFSSMYGLFDVQVDPEDFKRIDELPARYQYVPFQNQRIVGGAAPQGNWW